MRWKIAWFLLLAVIILPNTASGQTDPCDLTFSTPCVVRCPISGWGIKITVHADSFDCFRVYRMYCGESQWTLIYEGPDNVICDCGYNPSGHQLYRAERYWSDQSGACVDMYDDCVSFWQPSACPP